MITPTLPTHQQAAYLATFEGADPTGLAQVFEASERHCPSDRLDLGFEKLVSGVQRFFQLHGVVREMLRRADRIELVKPRRRYTSK